MEHLTTDEVVISYLAGFPGETPVVPGTAPLGDYMSSLYGVIGVMLVHV